MKRRWLFCVLAALFIITSCNSKQEAGTGATTLTQNPNPTESNSNLIQITNAGFSPAQITIKKGESVTFINKANQDSWPASAQHPTHEAYPEKGGCISSKFDACKPLQQNEEWAFTFNSVGEWKYHDHLNPGLRGQVNVQ